MRNDGLMRPLVVTTVDRLDLVLGLMGAQVSVAGVCTPECRPQCKRLPGSRSLAANALASLAR